MRSETQKRKLFEESPVIKAIFNLAIPSIVGQIILVIYNMADTFFVGLSGSDDMITAVTVCMPAFMFLSAISNLFGVGGASVISRSLGQQDEDRARSTAAFAIWGCIAVTALYSLGAFLFKDSFIRLLGGKTPIVHKQAVSYLIVTVVCGGIVTAMNTLLAHLVRAEGRSLQASIGIALGGVLNIGLDPLFMFVIIPGQWALGAAIATALSNVVALVYYIVIIVRQRKELVLSVRPSRRMFDSAIPRDVVISGVPACLMTLCENISYAVLDNLMHTAGSATAAGPAAAQAGVGVAKKVNMLAHSIVRGMTQGVLPLIGYNYGSGNRKRMRATVYQSAAISIGISVVCMTISLIWARPLVSVFIQTEGGSLAFGATFLRILCVGAPFSACAYTVISFFQATGRGFKSLTLALMRKGALDIPMMFLFFNLFDPANKFFNQANGIVLATPVADLICCVVAIVLFFHFLGKHGNDPAPALRDDLLIDADMKPAEVQIPLPETDAQKHVNV